MTTFDAEIEFYTELQTLQDEYNAAKATKAEDPARWNAAKHAYGDFRRGIRSIRDASGEPLPEGSVTPAPAEGTAGGVAPTAEGA